LAGGNVSNLPVVAPTNARTVQVRDESSQVISTRLKELNGGNIEVLAGGNVDGGVYFLGRGQGRIAAGGAFNRGADSVLRDANGLPQAVVDTNVVYEPGAMLGLMAGTWDVSAVEDLNLSYVFNPTILPFKVNGAGDIAVAAGVNALALGTVSNAASGLNRFQASVYFTYGNDAKVSLVALKGDVNWETNTQSLDRMHGTSSKEKILLRSTSPASRAMSYSILRGELARAVEQRPTLNSCWSCRQRRQT
jgi:hypothetical protein